MRKLRRITPYPPKALTVLSLILIFLTASAVSAQEIEKSTPSPAKDDVQRRIDRARALAAAHRLDPAARELETVRARTRDQVVLHVTSVMLVGIYIEEGNYARAEHLLDDTFRLQAARKDGIPGYFALAGQAVNSVRLHLHRYRTFGINIADSELPAEAMDDLSRLRGLMERMVIQAKALARNNPGAYDAVALLEDLSAIRLTLARDAADRVKWEGEHATARNALASSHTEIASIAGMPQITGVSSASTLRTGAQSEPQTIASGSLNNRATRRVVPTYPPVAKSVGMSGIVRVYVTVDETGRVVGISRTEGPVALKQAAEEAARGWQFSPTTVAGRVVRVAGYIEFNFTL